MMKPIIGQYFIYCIVLGAGACGTAPSRMEENKRIGSDRVGVVKKMNKVDLLECANVQSMTQMTLEHVKAFSSQGLLDEESKFVIFNNAIVDLGHYHNQLPEDVRKNLEEILYFIYEQGVEVDQVDPEHYNGNTQLMTLISLGRESNPIASLMLLKEFKADPFILDKHKKNALHLLLLKGHEVHRCIIDEILKRPAIADHINARTAYGDTALHIACARRDGAFIKQLLEKGADLNIENNEGVRPMAMLHLSELERRGFLSKEAYLHARLFEGCPGAKKSGGALEYVATVDPKIFNVDSQILEEQVQKFAKSMSQQSAM